MSRNESLAENARWIWAPNVCGPNHYVEFLRELHVEGSVAGSVFVMSDAFCEGEERMRGTVGSTVVTASEGRHGGRPSREGPPPSGPDCCAEIVGGVVEAWIQLSAETSLELSVNGRVIHRGPPREVAPYFYFDTINLRPHLRSGSNELRIVAHHQGKDSQSYQAGTPALLVAGKFLARAEDGGTVEGEGDRVVDDASRRTGVGGGNGGRSATEIDFAEPAGWRVRRIARYRADAHRLFGCVGFSEHVDFSAKDLPWERAVLVAKTPWIERPTALARDMPFLREAVRFSVRQNAAGLDKENAGDQRRDDLRVVFSEQPPAPPQPDDTEVVPPQKIRPNVERLRDGGLLLDMGQEVSGYVELTLRADHRTSVAVSYGEALSDDARVDATKAGMNYSDRLELPAGETITWRSYEKRAVRFLQLNAQAGSCAGANAGSGADTGRVASVNAGASASTNPGTSKGADVTPTGVDVIEARVFELCWPYEPRWKSSGAEEKADAEFASERSALIRRIREVSARTIELNTEDLLTDCPWRERAQYLDSQFYMGAMKQLFGTLEPIKRFLHQFPRGADKTGLIRACYPSPSSMIVIPDFSMSYAVLLLRYLELSGDIETVRKNLSLAVRGVEVFKQYEDADGLLIDVPGWIFLDNTFELPKFPRSAGLNAVYHGAHRALAELFRRCAVNGGTDASGVNAAATSGGSGAEEVTTARDFDAKADSLRAAFRKIFLRDGRLLDADSTLEHERHRQWIYHHGPGKGGSFMLRVEFRKKDAAHPLRLAVHGGARVWIDGVVVASIKEGGSWTRSAIYQPVTLPTPVDTEWHRLELEVEWSGIDWECFLSSLGDVEWRDTTVNGAPAELRVNPWPWLTQTTVGYAAYHGLLEEDEAKALLKACLPARYTFPFAKRTTPFFAAIADLAEGEKRILPCNVPASLFHFCHALKRYGMEAEARELLLPIYSGMLERGATAWWEEWNTGSSLCHAWASFVVEFLEEE